MGVCCISILVGKGCHVGEGQNNSCFPISPTTIDPATYLSNIYGPVAGTQFWTEF